MISRLIVLIAMLLLIVTAHAQPDSLWSRTYGGSGDDNCVSVIQTTDGGYLLAGHTDSFGAGDLDFWLVRTDANGDSLWSRTFGGNSFEACASAMQTTDGSYVLAGEACSFGAGEEDFWFVKTDSNGDSLWSHTFGGSSYDYCNSVLQTYDGGYVLAGVSGSFGNGQSDYWLVKTDANGDSLWSRTFGGSDSELCYSVQQTSDGGYALAGGSQSFGSGEFDFWLVKTDANGDSLWSRTFGGSDSEVCFSVQQTSDGGYVMAGSTLSFGAGNPDFWLMKTDANGDSLWSRTFGGSYIEVCFSVQQTVDGGYVMAGETTSFALGGRDFWLVKTDANGDSMWSRTFGTYNQETCNSLQLTPDGGYVLAGETHFLPDGEHDFWLVKTGPDSATDVGSSVAPIPTSISLSAFPNPFNSELTLTVTGFSRDVRISLHNLLGQEVGVIHDGALTGNRIHYSAPATLSSGLYFVRAKDERHVLTEKVVFMK